MRSIYFASTPGTREGIYCSVLQALVIENFIIAARSLCILETFASCGNLLLKWTDAAKKSDVENTDDDRNDEYTAPCKRRRSENAENGDTHGDQWMNDDDWQHEDEDNTTGQQGGTGYGDNGDGDDSGSDDDDNDDDENYEEEEEEEEESDDTKSFEEDMETDSLLVDAREVYASNYFRIFEREYRKSMAIDIDGPDDGDMVFKYGVHRCEDYSRKYKVIAQWFGGIVNCSCNYFSVTGFLCCHCLAVLPCLRVDKIPDCYLLKWQMKNFSIDQTLGSASLQTRKCQRPADDSTILTRGTNTPSLYDKMHGYADSTDIDYIFTPLLKHAKDMYIPEIYNLFREEYERSEYLSPSSVHHDLSERGLIVVYEVHAPRRPENYMVYSEPENGTVNCSCQKFASTRILCSHALLVLYSMDIVKIPPQYIVSNHLKGGYDVGNDNNGKIHGPRYARWRVKEKRSKMLLKLANDCKAVGFDPDYLDSCLGELSKAQSSSSKEEGGGGASAKSQKSEIMFWDDQGIRSFTHKKPFMTRKLCIQWRFSSRQSP